MHVQRALGWNGVATSVMRTETAPCGLCGAELRFTTGEYGQTLEVCTSTSGCPGRVPHRVERDPVHALKPPHVAKKRRGPTPQHRGE